MLSVFFLKSDKHTDELDDILIINSVATTCIRSNSTIGFTCM